MKIKLTILFISISIIILGQSTDPEDTTPIIENIKVGKWIVKSYDLPERYIDIWEFRVDSVFYTLRFNQQDTRDINLSYLEYGFWNFEDNKLKITKLGINNYGEQNLYKTPEVLSFNIFKDGNVYILKPIKNSYKEPLKIRWVEK